MLFITWLCKVWNIGDGWGGKGRIEKGEVSEGEVSEGEVSGSGCIGLVTVLSCIDECEWSCNCCCGFD